MTLRSFRTLAPWLTLALLAFAGRLIAQQAAAPTPQNPPQATFRTRVDSVSVDVVVTDKKGLPVTDLVPADFDIREGGKPQTIDTFKFIEVDDGRDTDPDAARDILSPEDQQRETGRDANRLFVILLDDYHVRLGNSFRVREQIAKWVDQLAPHDLVAVMYPLTPVQALTFSRAHSGTARAIMKFSGRKYDYTPRNALEERYQNATPEMVEQLRNSLTLAALRDLAGYLGTLRDGRKTILFVSEGLTGSIPAGVDTRGLFTKPMGTSESQAFFASTSLMSDMTEVFKVAVRSNTAIYTLDPRGLATGEFDINDNVNSQTDRRALSEAVDSLRVMADQTDGRAIVSRNDSLPMLKQMVSDSSAYYLMSYTSSIAPRDGKFHEIQVRVNRKDVDVRARKGYWAYSEEDIARAEAPAKPGPPPDVASALEVFATTDASISRRRPITTWIGASPGAAEVPDVVFAWEGTESTGQDTADVVDRVTITATSATGALLYRGPVPRDPSVPQGAGHVTFSATPGDVRVEVVSENARGVRIDRDETHLDVPDFTSASVRIATPQLFRGRTARDLQRIRDAESPTPTADRDFARTERLLLRFGAYGPGGTAPTVGLRWLNQNGDQIVDLPVPARTAAGLYETEVSLAPLPPGEYLLEISADAGGEHTRSLVAMRIH
jgi:VWFA-related protein